jgi:triosephosphate isomerase
MIHRKKIIAGNWKMNKTQAEARDFIAGVKVGLAQSKRGEGVSAGEARGLIKSWTSH